jgi:ketosteroid isomerase-like protein
MSPLPTLPIAVIALFCITHPIAAAEDADPPMDFLRSWAEAWSSGDVEKLMEFYDSAKETTAIESLGHVRRGPDEIRRMYEGAFEELAFERVRLTPIAQGRHDSVAWVTCRYRADIQPKLDNSQHVLEVLGTFVFKREGDGWKISMEHFSAIPGIPRVRPAGSKSGG